MVGRQNGLLHTLSDLLEVGVHEWHGVTGLLLDQRLDQVDDDDAVFFLNYLIVHLERVDVLFI